MAVLGIAVVAACQINAPPAMQTDSRILTRQEILASKAQGNAYDVIARLRPNFLHARGATSVNNPSAPASLPNVYVNGNAYGDMYSLRNFDVIQIEEIRYYSAGEAQAKFGTGNGGGAIAITTRTQ